MSFAAAVAAAALLASVFGVAGASAGPVPAPAWSVTSLATPTNFVPGDTENDYFYDIRVANIGAATADGTPVTITDTLPEGLSVEGIDFNLRWNNTSFNFGPFFCSTEKPAEVATVTCTLPSELPESEDRPAMVHPGEEARVVIHVSTPEGAEQGESLTNRVDVEGGGAAPASVTIDNEASSEPAPSGFSFSKATFTDPDGEAVEQASSHPYQYITSFAVNTKAAPPSSQAPLVPSGGDLKDIRTTLPAGLVGDTGAALKCTAQQFQTTHTINLNKGDGGTAFYTGNACPDGSAVGMVLVQQIEGEVGIVPVPLYNLVPPPGSPAMLGFQVLNAPFFIDTELRSGDDYEIAAVVRNNSQVKRVTAASVIVWGTPADPIHDPVRGSCINQQVEFFLISNGLCEAEVEPKPFLRMPTSCESPLDVVMSIDTWSTPGNFLSETSSSPPLSGCNLVEFEPSLEARPTTNVADSPTGLAVDLHIPQNDDHEELGEADLRKAVVTLPEGLVINPSGANGLQGCSSAQIDIDSGEPANCPGASKIGNVEVETPLLDEPLHGGVYVATPHDNPFDSLLAIYIAVDDAETGVVVKLAGHVQADRRTGRLTTTFDDNPQLPIDNFRLDFFAGALAPLRTPAVCGRYSTTSTMTPWSAPASGPPATPSDAYEVDRGPGGSRCATSPGEMPNAPAFNAGTVTPNAGAYSPFVMHLRREDGSQEFSSLTVAPPPGLLGKLTGIPYCPAWALQAAASKSGNAEKANPSCPAASRLGTVNVGAGAGTAPFYTQGTAYLSGPYRGAPLSMAVVTPAVAGPYDLGTVVVMAALHVDPRTAQITAKTDSIPRILEGIPLDVRSIAVRLDRPEFTINPTNCDPLEIRGLLGSTFGQPAALGSRFQVGGCRGLDFKPRLYTRLFGGTGRGAHPKLRAVVMPRPGHANIGRAVVSLPRSEFLDQGNIRTICTRVQFAANACPKGSIYGRAVAHSPLLDEPLRGPVYLRSSDNNLPDLVASLHGQVDIELSGRIDSVRGGIRSTFDIVPDAPVSKFVLYMKGGRKQGLLVNSRNICSRTYRSVARFTGQNGKVARLRPALKNGRCSKKQRKANRSAHSGTRQGKVGTVR